MAGRAFQTQSVLRPRPRTVGACGPPAGAGRADRCAGGRLRVGRRRRSWPSAKTSAGWSGTSLRTAGRYTDCVEVRRRRSNMSLSAELQWDMLLPPLAFRCPDVAVAGKLEPAYDVGGDGFDYSLNGRHSFVSCSWTPWATTCAPRWPAPWCWPVTATAVASVSAWWRRRMKSTRPSWTSSHGEIFVSGHLGQLDVASGQISWINAGHPDPLLARGCDRRATCTPLRADPSASASRYPRSATATWSQATGCCFIPTA